MNIEANIEWNRRDAKFHDNRYSRAHTWRFDGGANVLASSSPDIVPVPMSDTAAIDPEEAFVASLSSCHMLWFLAVAAKAKFVVDQYKDHAIGEMRRSETGKLVVDVVTLQPDVKWSMYRLPTAAEIVQMHDDAHDECFIANSVKTTVRIEPIETSQRHK